MWQGMKTPRRALCVVLVFLALAATLLLAGARHSLEAERVRLGAEADGLARRLASAPPPGAQRAPLPVLPGAANLARITADLPELAREAGVDLIDVSFAPATANAQGVGYSIVIGVRWKGRYADSRKLLAQMLGSHETLALLSLNLRRGGAAEALLDVDAQLAFHFGAQR